MENIIASILEIEQDAKVRLEEAERKKNQLITDAKEEQENLIRSRIREVEEKLGRMDLEEKKKADAKLAEIEENMKKELLRLDKVYDEFREKWEDDIFNAVISG